MLPLYKVCANIKPATIFFCLAFFITLPILANNQWKTKFPKSLTLGPDTIPAKHIDTLPSKKIIADSLKRRDTGFAEDGDTIINDTSRKLVADTLLFSKDSLSAPVKYTAEDSGVLVIPTKQFILYGKAHTDYQDMKLDANTIQYDQQNNLITAFGGTDTSKGALNLPTFSQGDQQSIMDTVRYNLKSQKGLSVNSYYKQGELFVNAQAVKKVDQNIAYAYRGRFTTCNLDTPHFDIRARKIKIINNKIAVSGPAFPEFEGVPIPIPIPFGIYPLQRGRHSGLLPPRFTTSDAQGLGLEQLGFYKVLSDYWDARVETDLYSYGGWNLRITPEYYKRYKYRGNFTFTIQHPKLLNQIGSYSKEEFTTTTNYHLTWTHSSDSKARPGTSFSANVDAGSTQYNRYITNNAFANYQNNLSSSISYNKIWDQGKYNLNVSVNENQNSVSRLINVNLPTVAFTATTIYPFQNAAQTGTKWYQKLGIGYSGNLLNLISFYDSAFNFKRVLDTAMWGFDHRIPISLSLPALGPFIVTPAISYEERWYAQKINYSWNGNKVDTTLQKGFYAAREMSFGLNTSTRIFGTFRFLHSKNIIAIRHEIDPFIGLSYTPDLVSKFYQTVKTGIFANQVARVSQLTGNVLGSFSENRFGGLNFGINNSLEMKVRNRKDTTGQDSVKKIRLIQNFSITSGLNLIPDSSMKSAPLSPFNINAGTSLLNNKLNITAGTVVNPYYQDSLNHYHSWLKQGKIGQLESGHLSLSTSLQSKGKDQRSDQERLGTDETLTPDEQQQQLAYVRANPGEFVDFNIPWSVQLSYSLIYTHTLSPDLVHYISAINSNVNINGDLSISPKWKFGGGFYFDFRTKKIAASSLYLTRDMHCWQMVIDINVGQFKSFSITLNPKSGILRDLRINKHFLQQ